MGYRYEYQGAYVEKDPVTGFNNFDLRMYDSRIGRWLSEDPKNIGSTPYNGMGNNPVSSFDKDGGDPNQGVDSKGNIVYDDHKSDGNIYLVNDDYKGKINDLKTLVDNSAQVAQNGVWTGSDQQLKNFISAQWLKADGGFDGFLI